MPQGTVGHLVIKYLGFQHNGWGIASTLYAMFSDDEEYDYFSNSRALNLVAMSDERAHVRIRDISCLLLGAGVIPSIIN